LHLNDFQQKTMMQFSLHNPKQHLTVWQPTVSMSTLMSVRSFEQISSNLWLIVICSPVNGLLKSFGGLQLWVSFQLFCFPCCKTQWIWLSVQFLLTTSLQVCGFQNKNSLTQNQQETQFSCPCHNWECIEATHKENPVVVFFHIRQHTNAASGDPKFRKTKQIETKWQILAVAHFGMTNHQKQPPKPKSNCIVEVQSRLSQMLHIAWPSWLKKMLWDVAIHPVFQLNTSFLNDARRKNVAHACPSSTTKPPRTETVLVSVTFSTVSTSLWLLCTRQSPTRWCQQES